MLLKDKVAIITGGGSGLGEAACHKFADEGCKVVVADFNWEAAKKVADEINAKYATPIPMQIQDNKKPVTRNESALAIWVDVSDKKTVDGMVVDVLNMYGQIDILINNAGIVLDNKLEKLVLEDWHKVIAVNQTGVLYCTLAVLNHMIERGQGRIINTSSVVRTGNFGQTAYSATKAAVVAMTKTWALELAKYDILVNAVAPGFMKTAMTAGMNQKALAAVESKIPLKKMGEPYDIAEAYVNLAKSNYVTGAVWGVDGGLVI